MDLKKLQESLESSIVTIGHVPCMQLVILFKIKVLASHQMGESAIFFYYLQLS